MESRGDAGHLPVVDVVVLAFGDEPWLPACLRAVLGSRGVDVRVQLVDNGCPGAAEVAATDARINLLAPGWNTGYAGGCVLGAEQGDASFLVFVNSDALVEPPAIRELVDALQDPEVGLATGCVLLGGSDDVLRSPAGSELVNAAGNPVHWLGFSWAGGLRDPVEAHLERRDVASVSGTLCGLRREVWGAVGGFDPEYFAYHEDVDLSLRVWCSGRRVVYIPEARCLHRYEFSRHPRKLELLERNRLTTVLTVYQWSTLMRIGPALLVVEIGSLLMATASGWGMSKLRAIAAVLLHPARLWERRRAVESIRRVDDSSWVGILDNELDLPPEAPGRVPRPVVCALRAYWRALGPE